MTSPLRASLIEAIETIYRIPGPLMGTLRPLPDGWEYGNDVDRALIRVLREGEE